MRKDINDTITAIYVIIDDILLGIKHNEDIRVTFKDAEIITSAIYSARYHGGNIEKACAVLKMSGMMPNMLSMSRLNRRLHRLKDILEKIFITLSIIWKKLSSSTRYVMDSFPVSCYKNIRIPRAKLFRGEEYRGYTNRH